MQRVFGGSEAGGCLAHSLPHVAAKLVPAFPSCPVAGRGVCYLALCGLVLPFEWEPWSRAGGGDLWRGSAPAVMDRERENHDALSESEILFISDWIDQGTRDN